MEEEWRDIRDCEGRYEVSNFGNVRSVSRNVHNHTGFIKLKGKVLKQRKDEKGYMRIDIINNNGVKKFYGVHRLVADAFLENPLNKPQVNHKDGNKSNNVVDNLEWCTNGENQVHAYKIGLNRVTGRAGRKKRTVLQIDCSTGEIVGEYKSISDAANAVGCKTSSNIGGCCRNAYGRKTICGYRWEYKKEVMQNG